jgi:hypothetical protein
LSSIGGKRYVIAVNATAAPLAAVTVGTGKTGVHIDFAYPAVEAATQVVAVGVYMKLCVETFVRGVEH